MSWDEMRSTPITRIRSAASTPTMTITSCRPEATNGPLDFAGQHSAARLERLAGGRREEIPAGLDHGRELL